MLGLLYFTLFLALSAALLRWQAVRYEKEHALVPRRRSGPAARS
jgi:hypothetical protein